MRHINIHLRFILLAAAATLATVFAGCSSQKPESVAEEFLSAYFAAEYEEAAEYCTTELGRDLLDALEQAKALDESIRTNIQKYTKNYRPQIIKTSEPAKKDSVIVNYVVLASGPDSCSIPQQIKESRVHVVKTEQGWKVSALK